MRAGPMRHRCIRRGYIEGKDALGQPSKVWGDLGKLWAEINIRYRKDVVAGQHLVHDGTTYEIIAPLATNQRDMLKLMCKTVKPK